MLDPQQQLFLDTTYRNWLNSGQRTVDEQRAVLGEFHRRFGYTPNIEDFANVMSERSLTTPTPGQEFLKGIQAQGITPDETQVQQAATMDAPGFTQMVKDMWALATFEPLRPLADKINAKIEHNLAPENPKLAAAAQVGVDFTSGLVSPISLAMVGGFGLLAKGAALGIRGLKSARVVAEVAMLGGAGVSVVSGISQASDAIAEGDEVTATKALVGAGLEAGMASTLVFGLRHKYQHHKVTKEIKNNIEKEVLALYEEFTVGEAGRTQKTRRLTEFDALPAEGMTRSEVVKKSTLLESEKIAWEMPGARVVKNIADGEHLSSVDLNLAQAGSLGVEATLAAKESLSASPLAALVRSAIKSTEDVGTGAAALNKVMQYLIRPSGDVLGRSGDPAAKAVRDILLAAERNANRHAIAFERYAIEISKDIKPRSPEGMAFVALLNTDITPAGAKAQFNLSDSALAKVVVARDKARTNFFDAQISQNRGWKPVSELKGKSGYIDNYFPNWVEDQAMQGNYSVINTMLPRSLKSRYLRQRTGERLDIHEEVSFQDIIRPYTRSMQQNAYGVPAVKEARLVAKDIKDPLLRNLADWHVDNFSGKSSGMVAGLEGFDFVRSGKGYEQLGTMGHSIIKFSQLASAMEYHALIGLNPATWAINLTQPLTNTWPEIGTRSFLTGIYRFLNPKDKEARELLRQEGIMKAASIATSENPTTSAGKAIHWGMGASEVWNRGITFLGALDHGKRRGLSGSALRDYALDINDRTNFNIAGRAGDIRLLRMSMPHMRNWKTFMLKEINFAGEKTMDMATAFRGAWKAKDLGKLNDPAIGVFGRMVFAWSVVGTVYGTTLHELFGRALGIRKQVLGRPVDIGGKMAEDVYKTVIGDMDFSELGSRTISNIGALAPLSNIGKKIARSDSVYDFFVNELPGGWMLMDDRWWEMQDRIANAPPVKVVKRIIGQ